MTEKDLEIQELRRELDRIKKYVPELRESLESLCTICNQISEAKCYRVACELCPAAKVKQTERTYKIWQKLEFSGRCPAKSLF